MIVKENSQRNMKLCPYTRTRKYDDLIAYFQNRIRNILLSRTKLENNSVIVDSQRRTAFCPVF